MSLSFIVNGQPRQVTAQPGQTLLDVLRDDLGVTGPKPGCGEGACGACTVLLGRRAVRSCQVDPASVAGQRITTVEGLAEDGILHPVQQAWLETGAMQCGYCTPGWLIGTAALLASVARPDDRRIDAELDGHVCRCCAYPRIRRAVHRAAELMEHPELLEPVPARTLARRPGEPGGRASALPERPWDRSTKPGVLTATMPDGLMAVVAARDAEDSADQDEAWVHVGADGAVTAFTGKVEAGQGTRTALALLVAEELAVSADAVMVAMADTGTSPFDWGTFGSRSMPHAAPPLRAAAAGALRLLKEIAADSFGLPPEAVTAADGMIAGPDGAPSASYSQLVTGLRRAELVPADGPVTPAAAWRLAGRPAPAVAAADVVTGAKLFPSDLRLDGMLHGCVLHAPAAGATLRQADTTAAQAMPGVTVVRDGPVTGVVAEDALTARAALAAIRADWDVPSGPAPAELASYLREHPVQGEGWRAGVRSEQGDPDAALAGASFRLKAQYTAAYVAHVPLEPRVALACWSQDQLTAWAATSTPFRARRELADALGLPEDQVQVIVPDYGGGFGGKHGSAVALEAALLARAAGRPVKAQWTREDEFRAGYLRPAAVIEVASGTDPAGQLTAWAFTNIHSGTAGLDTPYRVEHQRTAYQPADGPLARGSYRALAATANNFARESHMDELAAAIGADPVAFRLRHLDDERLAAVLKAAAAEIGWPEPGRADRTGTEAVAGPAAADIGANDGDRTGLGIAIGMEKGGRVATAARIVVAADGTVRLAELVTAVDCGAIVHPDGLVNQVEGAVAMGLGPALFEQIDFAGRRILNGSMARYRVPRLADVPAGFRVILIDRPDEPSAGGGEAPIIAVAPAIANAIFAAGGIRLRSMPLLPDGKVPRPG